MNTVFTIVAKNYLPLARALSYSIKTYNSTAVKFVIFLADEPDENVDLENDEEIIIPVSTIGIKDLTDLAFKYTVTEFCTAVKPACFKYVFDNFKSEKAIYFDPDIFVFNDLKYIFDDLEQKDIVVTPHYLTQQVNYTGDQPETVTLFVGIYNFGFVAFKNTGSNLSILDWWDDRLSDQCYADIHDALHTDQKWADFLPVYSNNRLLVSERMGYNLAPWNLFERKIIKNDKGFFVSNRFAEKTEPLVFVHFAGYDPNDLSLIHKDFAKMPISKYPDYELVRNIYIKITNDLQFVQLRKLSYTYSIYSNGLYVLDYHRRLYRALTEAGNKVGDPFSGEGEFYNLLKYNGLISTAPPQKVNKKTIGDFEAKLNKVNKLFRVIYKLIGNDRYFLLMKLLSRYSRPENQVFLLNRKIDKFY